MNAREAAPQTDFDDPAAQAGCEASAYDVVIVGGGPAGLSAALILARCRRRVVILDSGSPRNACARHSHGFLTRDGLPPAELLSAAREDLKKYQTIDWRHAYVTKVTRVGACFLAECETGYRAVGRRLLLATGVVDHVPEIPGLREFYGISVHHCPICDGWEWRDQPVAIYGKGTQGFGLAQELTAWTRDIVLLTDGPCGLDPAQREHLELLRIRVDERGVRSLEGDGGYLRRIEFDNGPALERSALFFCTGHKQRSNLAEELGCRMEDNGAVWTTDGECTSVEGLYVAGDSSKSAQLVIVAAAEGALAAVAINKSLTAEYKEAKRPAWGR